MFLANNSFYPDAQRPQRLPDVGGWGAQIAPGRRG